MMEPTDKRQDTTGTPRLGHDAHAAASTTWDKPRYGRPEQGVHPSIRCVLRPGHVVSGPSDQHSRSHLPMGRSG